MNLSETAPCLVSAGLTLAETDRRYFEAGSRKWDVLSGRLCVLPGYEHLPAGCVVVSPNLTAMQSDLGLWARQLEALFKEKGARLARFYLQEPGDVMSKSLELLDYRPTRETGMILATDYSHDRCEQDEHALRPVTSNEQWDEKRDLATAGGHDGPDGHNMMGGQFADLERVKCDAGFMQPFLFYVNGKPAAAICVSVLGSFARLKNLLVHPDYRGRGVGSKTVKAAIQAYRRHRGIRYVGVYADDRKFAIRIYAKQGLLPVNHQTEWSKVLE